jgi:hypothetical protein
VRRRGRLGLSWWDQAADGNHGRGVTIGITGDEQLRFGFAEAQARPGAAMSSSSNSSRQRPRILVVNGKMWRWPSASRPRWSATASARSGSWSTEVNKDPRRGEGHENVMTRIKIDALVEEFLSRSNLTPGSIPEADQVVQLRATANLSTGGTAVDRTNEIHPDNADIARRAALIVGLDVCGVDFVCPNISQSIRETGGGVIEVNAAPGLRMHIEPSEGAPRDVAKPIIEMLFPRGRATRVPIIAITGTNGKSTVGRMTKHIMRYTGCTVGLTSTTGVYINDVLIHEGDATGPRSARMILRDPTVEVAVLETARGGLLREGLAFAEADIGVALNVTADHLGLRGIETVEDLANVKQVVVEAVRRGGYSILNADDPLTVRMARRAGGRVIWFSLNGGPETSPLLREHIDEGGMAVVREPGTGGRHHRPLRRQPARVHHEGRRHPGDAARHGRVQCRQRARRDRGGHRPRRPDPHHPLGDDPVPLQLRAKSRPAQLSTTRTASASSSTMPTMRRPRGARQGRARPFAPLQADDRDGVDGGRPPRRGHHGARPHRRRHLRRADLPGGSRDPRPAARRGHGPPPARRARSRPLARPYPPHRRRGRLHRRGSGDGDVPATSSSSRRPM